MPAEKHEYVKGEGVKGLIAERQKEKEIRAKIISQEMAKLQQTKHKDESLFPSTTNMDTHNNE